MLPIIDDEGAAESLLREWEWCAREPLPEPAGGAWPDVDRPKSATAAAARSCCCSCCCCDNDFGGGGRCTGTELNGERSANGSPEVLAPGPGCPLSRGGAHRPGALVEDVDRPRWPLLLPLPMAASGGVAQGTGEATLVLPLPTSAGLILPLDPKPVPALPSGAACLELGVEEAGLAAAMPEEVEKASAAAACPEYVGVVIVAACCAFRVSNGDRIAPLPPLLGSGAPADVVGRPALPPLLPSAAHCDSEPPPSGRGSSGMCGGWGCDWRWS